MPACGGSGSWYDCQSYAGLQRTFPDHQESHFEGHRDVGRPTCLPRLPPGPFVQAAPIEALLHSISAGSVLPWQEPATNLYLVQSANRATSQKTKLASVAIMGCGEHVSIQLSNGNNGSFQGEPLFLKEQFPLNLSIYAPADQRMRSPASLQERRTRVFIPVIFSLQRKQMRLVLDLPLLSRYIMKRLFHMLTFRHVLECLHPCDWFTFND